MGLMEFYGTAAVQNVLCVHTEDRKTLDALAIEIFGTTTRFQLSMAAPLPVPKWDVDMVCNFLQQIGLAPLAEAFKTNAVNGSDLIELTDTDFKESLGCTPLQASVHSMYCLLLDDRHLLRTFTTS
jgi:hypothetical protein